ncbi:MAG: DUF2769 domain-containing protein [Candidatus Heimdallarchaeota archaeon]
MDKFEELMQKMMQMSEEERMKSMAENKGKCICAGCPSYLGTGETELLFCATEKSEVITEERGCTCPSCPVTDIMGLTHEYFCIRSSEREQRGMTM